MGTVGALLLTTGALIALLNVVVTRRLWASVELETSQKVAQTIMTWLIPGSVLAVWAVLRGQAPEESVLDTIYKLVRRYEEADWPEVERLAGHLGTPSEVVGAAYREALPWADEVVKA